MWGLGSNAPYRFELGALQSLKVRGYAAGFQDVFPALTEPAFAEQLDAHELRHFSIGLAEQAFGGRFGGFDAREQVLDHADRGRVS
jgi:hypothetical protein